MLKTKITVLILGAALSSNAFAVDPPHVLEDRFGQTLSMWGDHTIGPQPTVPPAKSIQLAAYGGGFFPPIGPMPFPPEEELPKLISDNDVDSDSIRFVGELIAIILTMESEIEKGELQREDIEPGDVVNTIQVIEFAKTDGLIEAKTADELNDILVSWIK